MLAYECMNIINNSDCVTEEIIDKACETIKDEIKYGSNMRGSAEYRQAVSQVLVKRALEEVL